MERRLAAILATGMVCYSRLMDADGGPLRRATMIPRSVTLGLCAVTFLVASSAYAVDVNQCWMVTEGRAEVISFDAETADGRQVTLKGLCQTNAN